MRKNNREASKRLVERIRAEYPRLLPAFSDVPVLVPIDGALSESTVFRSFRSSDHLGNAVEPLLEEASTLLSRCLANRRYKYELEEKALNLWLNDGRDAALVDVSQKLLDAGQYDLPLLSAERSLEAAKELEKIYKRALGHITESLVGRDLTKPIAQSRVEDTGELTAYLAQTSGVRATELAEGLEKARVEAEVPPLKVSEEEWQSKIVQNSRDIDQYSTTVPYAKDAKQLAQERIDVEKRFVEDRRAAWRASGSAFNYADRILEVQLLFDADLGAARSRCEAAAIGLNRVYGIDAPLPSPAAPNYLTLLLVWVREQLDVLSLKSEHSAEIIWTIQLNEIMDSVEWNNFAAEQRFTFEIAAQGSLLQPRIRAVRMAAQGVGVMPLGFCKMTAPELYSGESENSRAIVIGNVWSDDASLTSGVSRSRAMYNRLPTGRWHAEFRFASEAARNAASNLQLNLEFTLETLMG